MWGCWWQNIARDATTLRIDRMLDDRSSALSRLLNPILSPLRALTGADKRRVLAALRSRNPQQVKAAIAFMKARGWLERGRLKGQRFRRVVWRGHNMQQARIPNADFTEADLRGTNFAGAVLRECDFINALLDGVVVAEADLHRCAASGASAVEIDARGADISAGEWIRVTLRGANLQGADFEYADMRESNLQGVNAQQARFNRASLSGSDLRGADLRGADLTAAKLHSVNLTHALLTDVIIRHTGFSERTTLPDGRRWSPAVDLASYGAIVHLDAG